MRGCVALYFVLMAAVGFTPAAEVIASTKGKAMQALPGEKGGEVHVAYLQQVASRLEAFSKKAAPSEGGKQTREWSRNYSRWLRINSARMKDLARRWDGQLSRATGHSRQVADTNQNFRLQTRQLALQMLNENHQFGENCAPLLPRTEKVSLLLTPLQETP